MTALLWFRRDLRLHDHPALCAALERHERIVPVFCLDDRLLHGRHASGPRTQFLLECLHDLDSAIAERGGHLCVCHGPPEQRLIELAQSTGASEIHHTYDVSGYARFRGRLMREAAAACGLSLHVHPGLTVADDVRAISSKQGTPYSVFTPFHKRWLSDPRRPVLARPEALRLPARAPKGRIPSLARLGLTQELTEPARGGERHARAALERFLTGPLERYESLHDELGQAGTSRLSAYLRFGCLSPREVESRLPEHAAAQAFRRQLCWRDFYGHLLYHNPGNAHLEFQERYRGTISWSEDDEALRAWQTGNTGYPLVDAGMRQLCREGWMHNRARMIVGSFLTKDLGIDWRHGERWFMRMLLDGDQANNNGNWQWISSVGVDPMPVARRIFNPTLQMERFDGQGAYVRRYIPELRDVPDSYLREPWLMPSALQREIGCVIGEHYPPPIVDHRDAREQAIARYKDATGRA